MTVQTYRITWGMNKGSTKVILRYAGRDVSLIYRERNEALRKRVR